jgi:hypothetical protein
MPNRHVPGCHCCGSPCVAVKDTFDRETIGDDWTEDDGDWSIVDGALTTSDSDARITYDPGSSALDVYVRFKASDGDEIVLTGGGSGSLVLVVGASGKIQLYSSGSTLHHECDVAIPADEWVSLRVKCSNIVYINGVEVFGAFEFGIVPVVLGTGAITSPVYFDYYEQRHTYDAEDHPDCPACGGVCNWYPDGQICPVTFEIVGATDRWNGTYWTYYSRLNGVYEAAELNAPSGCRVRVSGLNIDVIEYAGSEVSVEAMYVELGNVGSGYTKIQLVNDVGGGFVAYEKYTQAPGDFCSGNPLTLPDTSVGHAEMGSAIITVP